MLVTNDTIQGGSAVIDQGNDIRWLSWTGMETHMIFNLGMDLPDFASFPLLETEQGRALLRKLYGDQIAVAQETGCGVCLESVTWMANADRAAALGYDAERLERVNRDAIDFLKELEAEIPVCISGQIGPRGDGYEAGEMTKDAAQAYHTRQIAVLAGAGCDMISAFTIGSVDEAIGMVRAAAVVGVPITVALTVETDGRLPDGTNLNDAITRIDAATSDGVSGYLVNCAHPDHLVLEEAGARLSGLVVNASRLSHAELDEAEELDDGNPDELGQQIGDLARKYPQMRVFGGCCGTDMRHLRAIGCGVHG
jgi:homocysteine S-methyltransferase